MFWLWVWGPRLTLVDMPELKVERVDSVAHAKFLADNPPADPYSLPAVVDAYREVFSCDVEFLQIIKSETPIASCALFTGTRLGGRVVKLMPIRAYDGVHFRALDNSKNQKQEYDRLMVLQHLEEYLRNNSRFYQLIFPPGLTDVRPFIWAGATVIPQYTYVVDLTEFSDENYTKSLREVLRSAERAGLSGAECTCDDLIALNQLSYERHGRKPPVRQVELGGLLGRLERSGLLQARCVKNKAGEITAAMASLKTERGSFLYVAGTNAQAEKGASHLLYHEILAAEKKAGRLFVDFVGANTPTINMFKSAFGPRLEVYFRIWRANGVVARLASVVKKV